MARKILCPYCFNKFDETELLYYCLDCGSYYSVMPHEQISGNDVVQLKLSDTKRGVTCNSAACHNRAVNTKKCPDCLETLPDSLFDIANMSFSLIGSTGSGKTNYITVLLTELSKRSNKLKFSLMPKTGETRQNHSQNRKRVYDEKLPLDSTSAGSERPSIWTISNLNKKTLGKSLTYVLNIFDGAGETHDNLDSEYSQRDARYIEHSEAVIFVIDPLRFDGLRQLAENIDEAKSDTSSSTYDKNEYNSVFVIGNTAELIRRALKIRTDKPIDMYVAIVISKMDLFLEESFKGQTLYNESPHAELGYFDMQDCLTVDREITEWLIENGESEFVNALEQNFLFKKTAFHKKKCFLFGVSAFGSAPDEDGSLPQVHPHRALDPLLWLLAQQDFIDEQ
jgi:GTPase SAR1 family protein